MEYQDYYKTLDVPRTATEAEIRKAYRKLAQKYHPDVNKNSDSEERLKVINEAYEVLKDPEKRKRYDALGSHWRSGQQFRPPPGAEDIFGSFMGNMGAGSYQSGSGGPAEGSGFSDFFEAFFGRTNNPFGGMGGATRSTRQRKGHSKRASMDVTLEDVYNGTVKKIQIETIESKRSGEQHTTSKQYDVKIPATIKDGNTIRLSGLGEPGSGGGENGDLLITINILPHSRFKVHERDIIAKVPIAPWEAAFGAKIAVPTLDGQVSLNIPAGSQSGQRLRLRGKGLQKDASTRGDMIVKVKIVMPKSLTEEEKELLEKLAKISNFNPRRDY